MTEEDVERTIRFLVEQQAQFITDLQKLLDNQVRLMEAALASTGQIDRLVDMMERLTDAVARTDSRMAELVEAEARVDARVSTLTQTVAGIVERLHSLILIVGKYISEGRAHLTQG
ncbi:MAG TPA: hypothetical protein VJH03_25340 [Blastocatellia bacterium]|nr:hypothetical protein [Blastocatellia bacterium]